MRAPTTLTHSGATITLGGPLGSGAIEVPINGDEVEEECCELDTAW